jgi:hypothetical protein
LLLFFASAAKKRTVSLVNPEKAVSSVMSLSFGVFYQKAGAPPKPFRGAQLPLALNSNTINPFDSPGFAVLIREASEGGLCSPHSRSE